MAGMGYRRSLLSPRPIATCVIHPKTKSAGNEFPAHLGASLSSCPYYTLIILVNQRWQHIHLQSLRSSVQCYVKQFLGYRVQLQQTRIARISIKCILWHKVFEPLARIDFISLHQYIEFGLIEAHLGFR